jgi:serine/threonine protein kinase
MDNDRPGSEETMSLRGSGKLAQPNKVLSQIRKAQVQAALFQTSQPVQIGRFTILHCIGRGAMGEIYAAYDEQLDRKVALKLVRSGLDTSKRAEERLLREAQTLARLSHPNVVQVYETGTYDGKVFIAMEFIRGQTLKAWLEDKADMPPQQRQRELLRMFIAAGRGLEAAHRTGVAHRDFKPDNVLVGHDGRVCVVDFGLARAVSVGTSGDPKQVGERPLMHAARADGNGSVAAAGSTLDMPQQAAPSAVEKASPGLSPAVQQKPLLPLTATGSIMGTPRYMSPEQMRGEPADQRSDQFSFCVALFHALYDEWPFRGVNLVEISQEMARGEVSLPRRHAEVPASIRRALLRGLAHDPHARFPSMSELLRAIEVWPRRGRRRLWALASAALVAVGATGYAAIDEYRDPCLATTSEIDALWSPDRKITIASAFAGSGRAYASTAF